MAKQKRDTRKPASGRLRIVAGKWRSRLLPVADVAALRPTAERIRETLFNWLAPVIEGAKCLDLFAGSGALGFEALSRGAAATHFVENAPQAVQLLRQNIAALEADNATLLSADALAWLQAATAEQYDIVFLDPPFAADYYEELCRLLATRRWLSGNARIYLEQERDQPLPELPDGWKVLKAKTAGNVRYALLEAANRGSSE